MCKDILGRIKCFQLTQCIILVCLKRKSLKLICLFLNLQISKLNALSMLARIKHSTTLEALSNDLQGSFTIVMDYARAELLQRY